MSLSLWGYRQGNRKKAPSARGPAVQPLVGARVALQRCPILHASTMIVPCGGPTGQRRRQGSTNTRRQVGEVKGERRTTPYKRSSSCQKILTTPQRQHANASDQYSSHFILLHFLLNITSKLGDDLPAVCHRTYASLSNRSACQALDGRYTFPGGGPPSFAAWDQSHVTPRYFWPGRRCTA